jgi:hypothetical protein
MEYENRVAAKLTQQLGFQQQSYVEGLPPAPAMYGSMPMSNRAGAVPVGPQQAMGQQYAQHPMMQDNYLQRNANPVYGRVQVPQQGSLPMPQMGANGSYFQSSYPQQQQPAYAPQQQYAQQQYAPQQVQYAQYSDPSADAVSQARSAVMSARGKGMSGLRAMGLAESSANSMANSSAGGAQRVSHMQMPDPAMFAGHGPSIHPMTLAG